MKYELLYIMPPQYTDEETNGVMEKVAALVQKTGGSVTRHENLGRLKLAYPIKQARHGTYVLAHIEAEASMVKNFDRQLRLSEDLALRHQIVTMPKGSEGKKFQLTAYVAPLTEEARRERVGDGPSMRPKPPVAPIPMRKEEASFTIAELDKKLDEILENDVSKGV
ncbi:MAG: 30S ribosomal protein S6 [Candidatus Uhrbacteria bacterium GW2011_GWA2_53_10]|uniref:Small ribosomal subunit protein bS6 n=1 Tax=Candidatus Uhrbacteria bacterium GW2011_GWA2_53_10 TaxID=1618980 RepID=A0A0G1XPE0_9BACT|nr:MAG: 30S ribosomal protein S6 [Candidatus Uhrbacteria bacterium GW2011_GWA2_53_10]